MASSIFDKRLVLVLGKGGVGRSTVAAAIASRCAEAGRRTLLFQANANDRFATYFGADEVDTEIRRLESNLYAVNTTPAAAVEQYGLMILRWRRVYNLVFENTMVKSFLRAIPGFEDYAVLGKAWFHTTEEKRGAPVWDTLVFDMPASGHSLSMLRIPKVILEAVPEGPLTRDARSMSELLGDRNRCAITLVTLAEEMPANEARELSAKLQSELDLTPDLLVVNQVYPDHFAPGSPAAKVLAAVGSTSELPSPLDAVAEHAEVARARRNVQRKHLGELANDLPMPLVELPVLFEGIRRGQISELSETLARALSAKPSAA